MYSGKLDLAQILLFCAELLGIQTYTHMCEPRRQKMSPIVAPRAKLGVKGHCLKAPDWWCLTKVRVTHLLPTQRFFPANLGIWTRWPRGCMLASTFCGRLCFLLQLSGDRHRCQRHTGCNYRSKCNLQETDKCDVFVTFDSSELLLPSSSKFFTLPYPHSHTHL